MVRYIAIDYGEKRAGIAISDPTRIIAQPLLTITFKNQNKLLEEIKNIVETYSVKKIILGLPVTMKGTDSNRTTEVRQFASRLETSFKIQVILADERLTTVHAHSILHQMGKKPSKHKERVDQLAAQNILQTYLDRENRQEQV